MAKRDIRTSHERKRLDDRARAERAQAEARDLVEYHGLQDEDQFAPPLLQIAVVLGVVALVIWAGWQVLGEFVS